MRELPEPTPRPGQVLVEIGASGVCHTDLHAADGDLEWAVLLSSVGIQIVLLRAGELRDLLESSHKAKFKKGPVASDGVRRTGPGAGCHGKSLVLHYGLQLLRRSTLATGDFQFV